MRVYREGKEKRSKESDCQCNITQNTNPTIQSSSHACLLNASPVIGRPLNHQRVREEKKTTTDKKRNEKKAGVHREKKGKGA
jgi:hypothetical protein